MSNKNELSETEVLFAEKEVVIGNETIVIKPYSWAQSMKLVKPLGVIVQVVFKNADKLQLATKNFGKADTVIEQVMPIIDLFNEIEIETLADAICEFLVTATKKDKEYIQSLGVDDVLEVGKAVYEVNKGFFSKRLGFQMNTPS